MSEIHFLLFAASYDGVHVNIGNIVPRSHLSTTSQFTLSPSPQDFVSVGGVADVSISSPLSLEATTFSAASTTPFMSIFFFDDGSVLFLMASVANGLEMVSPSTMSRLRTLKSQEHVVSW